MNKFLFCLSLFLLTTIVCNAQFHDAPISPTDLNVGISIITENGITEIEPIKFYKSKAGSGAFLSGLTYGIAKVKNKNYYKGESSPNKAKVGDIIRFSFGNVPLQFMQTHYMFSPTYTIRNFSLCKFDKKKSHRELKTAEASVWSGADTGVKENNDIEFEASVRGGGVYEAKIVKAEPGEYCFVFTDNGIGAYMNVFDFSIIADK